MIHRWLADALVVLHLGFVAWVVMGGLAALRRPRLTWLHLPAAAWGARIERTAGICPLTPLENHWRSLAGQAGYTGSFVEHYVIPVLYPVGLTPAIQAWLGWGVVALNLLVYAALAWRGYRRK